MFLRSFEVLPDLISWIKFTKCSVATVHLRQSDEVRYRSRWCSYFPDDVFNLELNNKFWFKRGLVWPFSHLVVNQLSKRKQLTNNLRFMYDLYWYNSLYFSKKCYLKTLARYLIFVDNIFWFHEISKHVWFAGRFTKQHAKTDRVQICISHTKGVKMWEVPSLHGNSRFRAYLHGEKLSLVGGLPFPRDIFYRAFLWK